MKCSNFRIKKIYLKVTIVKSIWDEMIIVIRHDIMNSVLLFLFEGILEFLRKEF